MPSVALLAFLLIMVVWTARSHRRVAGLVALFAVFITVAMVIYPDRAFQSALRGLRMWWDIVFPALLPFFIGSEILMGLGVVHFAGVLFEPLMRPLFNVPGVGAFVVAMGLASGYPIGAILTGRMRRDGLCSKAEAERLMSFANTSDPLFMAGAVAVGMFGAPWVGIVIMGGHYLSALCIGLLMRFYAPNAPHTEYIPPGQTHGKNMLVRAYDAMIAAKEKDGRPFGSLLGDSVRNSVNSLLLIGGFIILFNSVIEMLKVVGVMTALQGIFAAVLGPLGIDTGLAPAAVGGMFEITIGTTTASQAAAPLIQRIAIAGAVIAWSGLSVHGQVAAVIQGTDISVGPYMFARIFQSLLAGVFTFWIAGHRPEITAWLAMAPKQLTRVFAGSDLPLGQQLGLRTGLMLQTCGLLLVIGLAISLVRSARPRRA